MRRKKHSTEMIALITLVMSSFVTGTQKRSLLQGCSSSCGDIPIKYPFRLKGDPASCGDPDLELSCLDSKTILEYNSKKFLVKQISYDRHTIRIADINSATGKCNLPLYSVSVGDVGGGLIYTLTGGYKLASFLNCSKVIDDPAYRRLPCLGSYASHIYVVYNSLNVSTFCMGCTLISTYQVADTNLTNPSYDAVLKLMQSGFELGWSVECRNCVRAGLTCRLTSYETYTCVKPVDEYDEYIVTTIEVFVSFIATIILWLIFLTRCIIAPLIIFVFLIHKFCKERKYVDKVDKFPSSQPSPLPKRYSYTDITAITNNFQHKLGEGGLGSVYKGQLPGGCLIAVKMLENTNLSGEELVNEVSRIGEFGHVNVVKLLGFCCDGSRRALVYEYMPNGSLDKVILSEEWKTDSFSWEKLIEIALGTAQGIEYLHSRCDVHFNIKPHNIFLDKDFIPKVSDFCLAKFYSKENDCIPGGSTEGKMEYTTPELISGNLVSASSKSVVYSFGMLLLDLVARTENFDAIAGSSTGVYLPTWIYDHLVWKKDLEIESVTEVDIGIVKKLCMVGLWCIQMNSLDRPSMSKVVEMLQGNIDDLKMPPIPSPSLPQSDQLEEEISESLKEPLYGNHNVYSHEFNV